MRGGRKPKKYEQYAVAANDGGIPHCLKTVLQYYANSLRARITKVNLCKILDRAQISAAIRLAAPKLMSYMQHVLHMQHIQDAAVPLRIRCLASNNAIRCRAKVNDSKNMDEQCSSTVIFNHLSRKPKWIERSERPRTASQHLYVEVHCSSIISESISSKHSY